MNAENALPGSQQAGVEEIEEGPEIAQAIFHRCAAERDARPRIDLLGCACLLGAGCLDRLRLVQDGEAPWRGKQRGHAQQRSIAGDDEIDTGDPVTIERLQFRAGHRRRMRDDRGEGRREAFDLRGPIGQQGGRRDQKAGAPRFIIAWSRGRPPRAARIACLSQNQQQRQNLHRLAEAHVIGEAGAQAEAG